MDAISQLIRALQNEGVDYLCREELSRHTSFRIGGPAAVFCRPCSVQQLAFVRESCRQYGVRSYLLGRGSNMLFSDAGFPGVVIHLGEGMDTVRVEGDTLLCGAGAPLATVCKIALEHSLSGMESLFGIPGNIGGAVYMNAGAYGGEMKDIVTEVTFLDENDHLQTLTANKLELSYRTSIFSAKPWCILEARLQLHPGDAQAIRARMDQLMASRKEKQPLEWPSAGSTFKRPEGAFAAALIDQCGLKGMQVGGAAVSTKHGGFVVNLGGATCADVIALTEQVAALVKEKTGYQLEREIRVVE